MSKTDINEALASEIGGLGADTSENVGLGKLKNPAAYGQKEDLATDEQASLDRFLSKGRQLKEQEERAESLQDGFQSIKMTWELEAHFMILLGNSL